MRSGGGASVTIGSLNSRGAANGGGLQVGDTVISINGENVTSSLHGIELLTAAVGRVNMLVTRQQSNGSHVPQAMVVRPVRQTCKPTAKTLCVLGMLFLASGIVMIIMSQSIKQGWGVTAARCTVPNGWHCEFYQHRHKCQIIKGSGISCDDVQEYVPTFSIGGGSLGSSGSDIGGGISDEFSCSRYQLIEPAELEQCNQTAANLVGSVKACYFDEASDTCLNTWPGAGRHDEAISTFLLIAGIVVLVICALTCVSYCNPGRCAPEGSRPGVGLLSCIVCCVLVVGGIIVGVAAISEAAADPSSGGGLYDGRGQA